LASNKQASYNAGHYMSRIPDHATLNGRGNGHNYMMSQGRLLRQAHQNGITWPVGMSNARAGRLRGQR